jgi:hypothetical protein
VTTKIQLNLLLEIRHKCRLLGWGKPLESQGGELHSLTSFPFGGEEILHKLTQDIHNMQRILAGDT